MRMVDTTKRFLLSSRSTFLYHLKTGYCDEAVECYADAAHYAGRNGVNECYEG